MRQKSGPAKEPAAKIVKDIRRATRRQFTAEEKIRIVLEGLRGEESIAELCRREGIIQNLYYRWSKDFLERGEIDASSLGVPEPVRAAIEASPALGEQFQGFGRRRTRQNPRRLAMARWVATFSVPAIRRLQSAASSGPGIPWGYLTAE